MLRSMLSALAIAATVSSPSLAQTSKSSFPTDLPFQEVLVASDRNLADMRFTCAAGEQPAVETQMKVKGRQYTAPDAICLLVLHETGKRGHLAALYSRMQPQKAADELRLIIQAASVDAPTYLNVDGVTKKLSCELAFDAGYVVGSRSNDRLLPEKSDADIRELARRCFADDSKPSTVTALAAGVRTAQRDFAR